MGYIVHIRHSSKFCLCPPNVGIALTMPPTEGWMRICAIAFQLEAIDHHFFIHRWLDDFLRASCALRNSQYGCMLVCSCWGLAD